MRLLFFVKHLTAMSAAAVAASSADGSSSSGVVVVETFYNDSSFDDTDNNNWSLDSTFTLSGHDAIGGEPIQMPRVGLGVYLSKPGMETYHAVKWALELGYRLIDTAAVYGNEESVGQAIKEILNSGNSQLDRHDIFVTSKLQGSDHGYEQAIQAFFETRKKLKLDYLDLYLIHSPKGGKLIETWDALLHLQQRGFVRAVGVSNFDIRHLELLQKHERPLPAVNQIELHPLVYQERLELLRYCRKHGILLQAYGSMLFGQTDRWTEEPLASIVEQTGKTAPQVLLRWAMQHEFQVIPKSTKRVRLSKNKDLFEFALTPEQMAALDNWQGEPLGAYWNPLKDAPVEAGATHYYHDKAEEIVDQFQTEL